MNVRLDQFNPREGFERGRPPWIEAVWYLCKCLFFLSPLPWPSSWKAAVLRAFGCRVGTGVVIKPRVNIHLPWRLSIGDHCWIGEEVFLLNLEQISIGDHCCISQRAFLCTGNHDYRDPSFRYRNAPIVLETGVWIGAQAFVGPGVNLEAQVVVAAGSVVTRSLPGGMICGGSPCIPLRRRWLQD